MATNKRIDGKTIKPVSKGVKRKNTIERKVDKFTCLHCGETKGSTLFYKNPASPLGICSLCVECCHKLSVDDNGEFVERERFITLLQKIDRPFVQSKFRLYCQNYDGYPKKIVGGYIGTFLNRAENRNMGFADSVFTDDEEIEKAYAEQGTEREPDVDYGDAEDVQTGDKDNTQYKKTYDKNTSRKKTLQRKWGNFDRLAYLERCEQMYEEISNGGYNVVSPMHEVSLRQAIKLQIDYAEAQEDGDYDKMARISPQLKTAREVTNCYN